MAEDADLPQPSALRIHIQVDRPSDGLQGQDDGRSRLDRVPEHAFEFDVLRCILFWVEDREMTQATSSDDHGVRELNGRLDQVGLQECITDESGHLQARANEARVQGGRAKWCLLSCMCIPRFKLDLHGARGPRTWPMG